MKFYINRVILWPKKTGFKYRELKFSSTEVNIITGASRTGKSAIIPIVDYCLGSSKCTIPVDTIRNACAWFGVLFDLEDEQLLLCRREPGSQNSTNEMFILRGNSIEIPEEITSNTNLPEVNNILNELFSISFLGISTEEGNYGARVSYRDFMAFLFQPQNVIANGDVMFYKTDTTEHRTKLINIFPYALGAITPAVLATRQEIERLSKQKDRLQRDIDAIKDVSDEWQHETASWINRARELGLTDVTVDANMPFEAQVQCLQNIAQKTEIDSSLVARNVQDFSRELISLRKEEQEISSKLFVFQRRYTEMCQLTDSISQYQDALQIQVQRLDISTWLKSLYETSGICPFCNKVHEGSYDELETLCQAITEIEQSAANIKTMPAAFERELREVSENIAIHTEKLNAIRNRIREESDKESINSEKKYTFSAISRFLGQLDANLKTYVRLGKDEALETKLASIEDRILELRTIVDESSIRKKQEAAIRYINQKASEIVQHLDVEHPDDPLELLIKDLTIKVKNTSGRDDYLWEIGSASNWLGYHLALLLALQQYFQTKGSVSVPSFIIFDQPSQVYFPQRNSKSIDAEDKADDITDEDKIAVKKIFEAMSEYLQATNCSVQIIVTEHADEDIWGDVPALHLVERWRGNNQKLIPTEWLD